MTPHISVSLLGTQSDERLASLAGSGHERAFEAIVERYSKALTRYAQRFLGQARAEEVVQAAFLSAWSALTTGTEVRDLRPWLYRIVHNGALNAMNRSESGDLELIEAPDAALSPHAILEQNEEVRSALNVIAELPERQRAALLAVAVDGRAHADVAADLGVSDAGVRQLVRRARVQLRTAATALTPLPLALWLAEGQRSPTPDISHRIAEVLADGGGNALASSAMKAGAIVASVAAVATAAPKVSHVIEQGGGSEPAAAILGASAAGASAIGGGGPAAAALIPGLGIGSEGSGGGHNNGGPNDRGHGPDGFGAVPGDPTSGEQPAATGDPFQQPDGQSHGQDMSTVFAPLPTVRRPGGGGNSDNGNSGGSDRGVRGQPDAPSAPSTPDQPSTPSKPDKPSTPRNPDRPST
ncbi:MAG: sigma-70 family RNA polymerase sigma factor, partial [Solirubrobacterales bacterium]|nr:sigma-70 family RNA polymerase sigma factor [Solirubrobacterales bacterium]